MDGFKKALEAFEKFYQAQKTAEAEGNTNFVCPLCGGDAWWGRASNNHHLHMGCRDCGFRTLE